MSHDDSGGLFALKGISSRDRDSNFASRAFDIIAVHGLGGHREESWTCTNDEGKVQWLKDFLPTYVPNARIMTFGYSLECDGISAAEINEIAYKLLDQIAEKALADSRPFIFLGHDIGATIIKQALLLSSEQSKYQEIVEKTSLVVFFGCPHRAVDSLTWERIVARLIFAHRREYRGQLSKILETSGEALAHLGKEYETIAGIYETISVYEAEGVDDSTSTWLASDGRTMPRYSATFDLPCETQIARQGPHGDICKFATIENEAFRLIREKIYQSSEPRHVHILKILSSLDCKSYLPTIQIPKGDTSHWIKDNPAYTSWLTGSGPGLLQVQGQPGSGKSFVASYLSSSLRHSLSFSFDTKDERHRSTYRLLASLCHQLLSRQPELFDHVQYFCNMIGGEAKWTVDKLWVLFRSLVSCPRHGTTICVIDAIDECETSDNPFLNSLLELPNLLRPHFKLVVTNTKTNCEQTWNIRFKSTTIDLDESNKLLDSVAKHRVSEFVFKNPAFRTFQSDLERSMTRKHNSALTISLKLALLEDSELPSTTSSLHEELNSLPDTLNEIYERFVNRIPLQRAAWARKVVSWILLAFRPLKISELATAAALEPTTTDFESIRGGISQDIALDLRRTFGPLVKIVNDAVFFFHNSFQDFLLKGQDETWPGHFTSPFNDHGYITQTCLNYLSIIKQPAAEYTENGPRIQAPPGCEAYYDILAYAVQYWPAHYRLVQKDIPTLGAVHSFLSKETLMQNWSMLSWSLENPARRRSASFMDPLPIAAEFGFAELIAKLLYTSPGDDKSRSIALEVAAYRGSKRIVKQLLESGATSSLALHMAASNGSVDVVRELLDHQASVKAIDLLAATALHIASRKGHSRVVDLLLQAQSDIHAVDKDDSTPLHLASVFGHVDVMQSLLKARADPLRGNKHGSTPLHIAVESQQLGAVKELLSVVALDSLNNKGETPLHLAADSGRAEIVQMLIQILPSEEKHRHDILDRKELEGGSPLHRAAQKGHVEVVILLLEARADSSAQDDHGCLPLHFAARKGHLDVVRLLVGVNEDHSRAGNDSLSTPIHLAALHGHTAVVQQLLPYYSSSLDMFDESDSTPLHLAAANGHAEIVQILLDAEAETDILNEDQETPLHLASRQGSLPVVRMLLMAGSDPTTINDQGCTPLHVACKEGQLAVVKELLHETQHSLDDEQFVNLTDGVGITPLHLAALSGDVEVFKEILKSGAGLGAVDDFGQTLLHFASKGGNVDVMEMLLKEGAEASVLDKDKCTSLHYAAEAGHFSAVMALLNAGANPNASDKDIRRPLHCASKSGHVEIIKELLNHGAEIDALDRRSRTALHLACQQGRRAVVEALLEQGVNMNLSDADSFTPLDRALEADASQDVIFLLLESMSSEDLSSLDIDFALQTSAKKGYLQVVRKLLTIPGVKPGKKDEDGRAPLSYAAKEGHLTILKLLLNQPSVQADTTDDDGRGPFSYAAEEGHFDIIQLLLDRPGIEIDRQDKDERTALSYAAENDHVETVRLLLDASINADSKCKKGITPLSYAAENGHLRTVMSLLSSGRVNLDSRDIDNQSVLWKAAGGGHEKIVKMLIEQGADLNAHDNSKTTVLLQAASQGHAKVVKALLGTGKVTTGNARNDNGESPMYEAAYYAHVEVLEELLKHHLDTEIEGPRGWRPLHAGYDDSVIVERLLAAKAEVDAKTPVGDTALALAVSGSYERSISLLLAAGANPLSRGKDGNTPIHKAADAGDIEVLKQLLDHTKGDTDVTNSHSETPLSLAAKNGTLEVVNLLMKIDGVNLAHEDKNGSTPLLKAVEGEHFEVVKALLEQVKLSDAEEDCIIQSVVSQANSSDAAVLATHLVQLGVNPDKRDKHGWSLRLFVPLKDESKITTDLIHWEEKRMIEPYAWSMEDKLPSMELGEDNMTVMLKGRGRCGTIITNHPIPYMRKFYFEIEILDAKNGGGAVIGLCQESAQLDGLPGWDGDSWGYHGDSGELYHDSGWSSRIYAEGFGKHDKVGCCVIPKEQTVYFTRNGKRLPPAFGDFSPPGRLYPCVGLVGEGAHVRLNFGKQEFMYNEDRPDGP